MKQEIEVNELTVGHLVTVAVSSRRKL